MWRTLKSRIAHQPWTSFLFEIGPSRVCSESNIICGEMNVHISRGGKLGTFRREVVKINDQDLGKVSLTQFGSAYLANVTTNLLKVNQILFSFSSDKDRRTDSRIRRKTPQRCPAGNRTQDLTNSSRTL